MKALDYIKSKRVLVSGVLCLFIVLNLYLGALPAFKGRQNDLIYLDVILLLITLAFLAYDFSQERRKYQPLIQAIETQTPLHVSDIMGTSVEEEYLKEILLLQYQNESKVRDASTQSLKEMEEYLTKWVHEIKLPLATLKMMVDRVEDYELASNLKLEIEKMNVLVNGVLYGSRTTSSSEDIVISEVSLQSIVKTTIKNNAFFLIKHRIEVELDDLEHTVLTDQKWMVYVLDQLLQNAIKYRGENGNIKFKVFEERSITHLVIQDNGIGIKAEECDRIFNKGFTGSNGRINTYKSTGMGLYFVKRILDKLGHDIKVNSVLGEGTSFTISFYQLSDYIKMTKM